MPKTDPTSSIFYYRKKSDKRLAYTLIVIFFSVGLLFYFSVSESTLIALPYKDIIREILYIVARLVAVVFIYFPFMIFRYLFRPRKIILERDLIFFPKKSFASFSNKKVKYSRIKFIKKTISNKLVIRTRKDEFILKLNKFDNDLEVERFFNEVKQKIQR